MITDKHKKNAKFSEMEKEREKRSFLDICAISF